MQVTVDAVVMTVLSDMKLQAGNRVLVVGNTIIGIYNEPITSTPKAGVSPEPELPQRIRAALIKHGPLSARDLGTALGYASSDATARTVMQRIMRQCVKNGSLRATSATQEQRYPTYELTTP